MANDENTGEITVSHDELIDQITARSKEEYARQSDAGESGAKVNEFLEKTGMNGQAFGWLKSIMKKLPKKDGASKALDIIRSLEKGLPMVKNHIEGQEPSLGLGDPADYEDPEDEPEDEDDGIGAEFEDGDDLDPEDPEQDDEGDEEDGDEDTIQDDADDFEAALAELGDDDESNVTPLKKAGK